MVKESYYEQTKIYEKYFEIICENINILNNEELDE